MDILTHCYKCNKSVWDFRDLCFTRIPEEEAAVAFCADCGRKRGLKTVAEIAEKRG